MVNVLVTGFETEEQAAIFMDWFEGQGEQDCISWFQERLSDNKNPVVNMKEYIKERRIDAKDLVRSLPTRVLLGKTCILPIDML